MFDLDLGYDLDVICRDEKCRRPELHFVHRVRGRSFGLGFGTRSKRYAHQPWKAHSPVALRESVFAAVSLVEPRNFLTIWREVQNDYGGTCGRSVHRHLSALIHDGIKLDDGSLGRVIRLDFRGRAHAYLREGSRLVKDPELVYEQIMNLHAEAA